jgi:hypothetical protein
MSNLKKNRTYPTINNMTEDVIQSLFVNKTKYSNVTPVGPNKNPHFIIKYGPPASGKGSSAVKKEIENLGISINDCIIFDTDKVIESLQNYRNETFNLYSKTDKSSLDNIMPELSKIYFEKRTTKNKSGKSISNKMDNLFMKSMQARQNIIFETTGQNFNDYNPIIWVLDMLKSAQKKYPDSKPYLITVIYPVVNEEIIYKRINSRTGSQLSRNPPFYRTISKKDLKKHIDNCKLNFYFNIIPMILYFGEIHKIVVFENNDDDKKKKN